MATDNTLTFMCKDCNKNYGKEFDKNLTNRFKNTSRLCDRDLNKFPIMLGKGFYRYKYIDSWQRFNEMLLLKK